MGVKTEIIKQVNGNQNRNKSDAVIIINKKKCISNIELIIFVLVIFKASQYYSWRSIVESGIETKVHHYYYYKTYYLNIFTKKVIQSSLE